MIAYSQHLAQEESPAEALRRHAPLRSLAVRKLRGNTYLVEAASIRGARLSIRLTCERDDDVGEAVADAAGRSGATLRSLDFGACSGQMTDAAGLALARAVQRCVGLVSLDFRASEFMTDETGVALAQAFGAFDAGLTSLAFDAGLSEMTGETGEALWRAVQRCRMLRSLHIDDSVEMRPGTRAALRRVERFLERGEQTVGQIVQAIALRRELHETGGAVRQASRPRGGFSRRMMEETRFRELLLRFFELDARGHFDVPDFERQGERADTAAAAKQGA